MKRTKKLLLILGINAICFALLFIVNGPELVKFQTPDIANPIKWSQKTLFQKINSAVESPRLVSTSGYKFQNYDINKPEIFRLKEDTNSYFRTIFNVTCFDEGTNWEKTIFDDKCHCLVGWYGNDCGVPKSVWPSLQQYRLEHRISRRKIPRRVLNALNVNHEFDTFEARINELGNSVDVYLVGESNYSAFGEKKSLWFYERFRSGFMKDVQAKVVYVFQDHFPKGGREDGWIADDYQRSFLSKQGLKQVSGLRDDDIFLLSDADELPKREVITFLKLYDNYYDTIYLSLTWTIYTFYWLHEESPTHVRAATTINTFKTYFDANGAFLRRQQYEPPEDIRNKVNFHSWQIGSTKPAAGWHCSWCFINPEDVRIKLISAQNGDRPRWGDFPEKSNINYIKHLIRTGTWFNDKTTFILRKPEKDYAPNFYLLNAERFHSILFPPTNKFLQTHETIYHDFNSTNKIKT